MRGCTCKPGTCKCKPKPGYPKNIDEAANPAQQAAIAISMKKAGKKPKSVDEADMNRRGFLKGMGAAAVAGAAGGAKAGDFKSINDLNKDPESVEKVWKPRMAQLQARCSNILKSFVSVAPQGYDAAEIIQNAKLKITLGEEQFKTGYSQTSWRKDAKGNLVGAPSGEIFLDTTVFWDAPDEVLAFILGHELGHVILRHGIQTGDIPVDPSPQRGQRNELEADNMGAYLARQLGYNKAGYFKFLFGKRAEYMTDMNANSSHPSPAIRAKSMSQGLGKKIDFELSHNAVKYIDSMVQQFQSGLAEEATDPTNKPISTIPRWLQILTKDYPITQFEKARYAREKHNGYNKWADNQEKLNDKDQGVAEDWQKVNKKDKTSGMSKKAVSAYRRENPGSKLKTAVTTKPSKLKKGSKAANRRKSFCARMGGMKKHNASAKTKRDPDSPINKALRRWNCESIEQMQELVMIAEQMVRKAKL